MGARVWIIGSVCLCWSAWVCGCACVCLREREREREGDYEKECLWHLLKNVIEENDYELIFTDIIFLPDQN